MTPENAPVLLFVASVLAIFFPAQITAVSVAAIALHLLITR